MGGGGDGLRYSRNCHALHHVGDGGDDLERCKPGRRRDKVWSQRLEHVHDAGDGHCDRLNERDGVAQPLGQFAHHLSACHDKGWSQFNQGLDNRHHGLYCV